MLGFRTVPRGAVPLFAAARPSQIGGRLGWPALYVTAGALLAAWLALPTWAALLTVWLPAPLVFYLFTPLGARAGAWRYLSAYLVLQQSRGVTALHLGTTYDILWRLLPARKPGERLFQTMHRELYSGLAAFCQEVERGEVDGGAAVTACSYFLTPKQMARYGFRETSPTPLKKLCFVVGYPEILLQQLLITGR
ncbi:MAG: hypothetical protein ACO1SX_00005, partial [Actinomycetota bacterium]